MIQSPCWGWISLLLFPDLVKLAVKWEAANDFCNYLKVLRFLLCVEQSWIPTVTVCGVLCSFTMRCCGAVAAGKAWSLKEVFPWSSCAPEVRIHLGPCRAAFSLPALSPFAVPLICFASSLSCAPLKTSFLPPLSSLHFHSAPPPPSPPDITSHPASAAVRTALSHLLSKAHAPSWDSAAIETILGGIVSVVTAALTHTQARAHAPGR